MPNTPKCWKCGDRTGGPGLRHCPDCTAKIEAYARRWRHFSEALVAAGLSGDADWKSMGQDEIDMREDLAHLICDQESGG